MTNHSSSNHNSSTHSQQYLVPKSSSSSPPSRSNNNNKKQRGGHHGHGHGGHGHSGNYRRVLAVHSSSRRGSGSESEVSCCLKYLIFGFNVCFWIIGLSILVVGVWAWSEKETLSNLSKITRVALDPAFILVLVGTLTFVIGFTGCIGALRENTCLLAIYAIFLAAILLVEIGAGLLGFIFKDWIKAEATSGFQSFIVSYREDPDQQNLIDWIQERWLHCCGIEGPKDWDRNVYFNCNSTAREACGVPFSCCKLDGIWIRNTQCGYDVRKSNYPQDRGLVIYDRGCLRSGEEWVEANLIPVAAVAVAVAILQILGICFAQNLRADVFAQRSKWRLSTGGGGGGGILVHT